MTLRSVSNLGPVTETGSSSSWENTAREQVASKPMPRIEAGFILCWLIARCTEMQMQRQISVVDCSWVYTYQNDTDIRFYRSEEN